VTLVKKGAKSPVSCSPSICSVSGIRNSCTAEEADVSYSDMEMMKIVDTYRKTPMNEGNGEKSVVIWIHQYLVMKLAPKWGWC
jgi:hypothetical protein